MRKALALSIGLAIVGCSASTTTSSTPPTVRSADPVVVHLRVPATSQPVAPIDFFEMIFDDNAANLQYDIAYQLGHTAKTVDAVLFDRGTGAVDVRLVGGIAPADAAWGAVRTAAPYFWSPRTVDLVGYAPKFRVLVDEVEHICTSEFMTDLGRELSQGEITTTQDDFASSCVEG